MIKHKLCYVLPNKATVHYPKLTQLLPLIKQPKLQQAQLYTSPMIKVWLHRAQSSTNLLTSSESRQLRSLLVGLPVIHSPKWQQRQPTLRSKWGDSFSRSQLRWQRGLLGSKNEMKLGSLNSSKITIKRLHMVWQRWLSLMQTHSAKGKMHADPLARMREWQFVWVSQVQLQGWKVCYMMCGRSQEHWSSIACLVSRAN